MANIKTTYASFYFSTPVETVLAATVSAKALGTTTPSPHNTGFDHTDNRLTLQAGMPTRVYHVTCSLTVIKGSGGATLGHFFVAKNGVIDDFSEIGRTIASASDEGAFPLGCLVELAAEDYLEIFFLTDTGDNMTAQHGGMIVRVAG